MERKLISFLNRFKKHINATKPAEVKTAELIWKKYKDNIDLLIIINGIIVIKQSAKKKENIENELLTKCINEILMCGLYNLFNQSRNKI